MCMPFGQEQIKQICLVHLDPNRNFSGFNCPPYARYSLASGAQSDTANEQNSILATIPSPPDVAPAPVRPQAPISVDEPASVQFSFASPVAAEISPSRSSNSSCAPVEQRLNQRLDVEYSFAKPQNSDQDVVHHEVPPSQSRFNGVRDERRKRQREFSHRTKTGCLTCRRRKKKCDEAKPECGNCIKGNHVCDEYAPLPKIYASWADSHCTPISNVTQPPHSRAPGADGYQRNHDHRPYDQELSSERDRAATACWRFNKLTCPPTNGVSTVERGRLFFEIIQPTESFLSPNIGCVGLQVAVETPFTCSYGYNISIGNNVSIGRACTMDDAGKIQVGDNCVIGPNVSMYTVEASTDVKHLRDGRRPQVAKGITIHSDCWIDGSVVITPGRVIGKGSIISAGSVVTQDVPPFTVVVGNPASVLCFLEVLI
ncbi:bacterial transferase hexapeptide [Beauveria bassiana ARSEF 2860]|uniref:Bacterial transferase hexapeptide n=1 Tax=Beauveria bassiana (strain ARSEF 2860) TaxID=655819 RepID=J5J360_BEAB2|nr:bacterial transferase hexapeptide [Beauveria bassiana ARSEF 2860]EJP61218.1 bacterial transferase hexapeptide [Beauveria bassiana ARSEF 2860]